MHPLSKCSSMSVFIHIYLTLPLLSLFVHLTLSLQRASGDGSFTEWSDNNWRRHRGSVCGRCQPCHDRENPQWGAKVARWASWEVVGLGKAGLCGVPAAVQNFPVVNMACGHVSWLIGVFLQIQRMSWEITRLSSVRNPPDSVVRVMPVPTTTIAKTEDEVQGNINTGTVVLDIVLPSWVVQDIGNLWCRRQGFDH